jgi:methylated-DNA-[protein]-cysteine S-methyltransferase
MFTRMNTFFSSFKIRGRGIVWITKGPRGICRVQFGGSRSKFLKSLPSNVKWRQKKFRMNPKWIATPSPFKMGWARNDFFGGPLDLSSGTPFQQKVWRQIAKIPRGETRSYAWLAKMTGRPKAVRAAANACGANPIPLIIPCHRVIKSDGTIGGFSGPLRLKKRLLRLEGLRVS